MGLCDSKSISHQTIPSIRLSAIRFAIAAPTAYELGGNNTNDPDRVKGLTDHFFTIFRQISLILRKCI